MTGVEGGCSDNLGSRRSSEQPGLEEVVKTTRIREVRPDYPD